MVCFLCFNTSLLCHFIRLKCGGYVYTLPNISSSLPATINSTHAQIPKSPPHSKISSKPTSKNPHLSHKTPTNQPPQKIPKSHPKIPKSPLLSQKPYLSRTFSKTYHNTKIAPQSPHPINPPKQHKSPNHAPKFPEVHLLAM